MYKNKVLFVFPPGWFLSEPYLALPYLKGFADDIGEKLDIYDDNIEFFDTITKSNFLLERLKKCLVDYENYKTQKLLDENQKENFRNLFIIDKYKSYLFNIDYYKEKLLKTNNMEEYKELFKLIFCAFNIYKHIYKMIIKPDSIKSNIYCYSKFTSLINFVDDKTNNIFYDYYYNSDILNMIKDYDYIGFSITTESQLASALTLINIIKKEKNISTKFLFGGSLFTRILNDDTFDNAMYSLFDYIDFGCLYEGENLLRYIFDKDFNHESTPNVIFRRGEKIIRNKVYTGYDIENYVVPNFEGFGLHKYFSKELILPLLSSKNCYSKCSFCTIPHSSSKRNYRVFDLDLVIESILFLREKYKTEYFTFNDEVFNLKRMLEFSNKINNLNNAKKFYWMAESRMDCNLSVEQFKAINSAGCKIIQYGLESYNQRVLDIMEKGINIDTINNIINNTLSAGISIHLFAIIGFPTESLIEANITKNYLLNFLYRAKNEFNIYTCSVGHGAFQLDKGSDVFINPSKYEISFVEVDRQDSFNICYRYNVKTGLSLEEAEKFVFDMEINYNLSLEEYYPENFVLFSNNSKYNKIFIDTFVEYLFFDPLSENCREGYYYYNLRYNKIYYTPLNINMLSKMDKDILKLYKYITEERKFELTGNYTINQNCIDFTYHGKNFIRDTFSNNVYELPEICIKIYDLIRTYGYSEFLNTIKYSNKIRNIKINNILELLYSTGILIKC